MSPRIEPTVSAMNSNSLTKSRNDTPIKKDKNGCAYEKDVLAEQNKLSAIKRPHLQMSAYLKNKFFRMAQKSRLIEKPSDNKKLFWSPETSRKIAETIEKHDQRFNGSQGNDLERVFFDEFGEVYDPVVISRLKNAQRRDSRPEESEGTS